MGEEGLKLPEFFVDVIYGWLVAELQIVGGSTFRASERLRVCGSVLNLRRRRPVSTRGYGTPPPPPPGWAGLASPLRLGYKRRGPLRNIVLPPPWHRD